MFYVALTCLYFNCPVLYVSSQRLRALAAHMFLGKVPIHMSSDNAAEARKFFGVVRGCTICSDTEDSIQTPLISNLINCSHGVSAKRNSLRSHCSVLFSERHPCSEQSVGSIYLRWLSGLFALGLQKQTGSRCLFNPPIK